MVNPQIWEEIPDEHVRETEFVGQVDQGADSDGNSNVAQNDQLGILFLVQWTVGVEMVDTTEVSIPLSNAASLLLKLVVVVASNVGCQIHPPSAKLLSDQVNKSENWSLLGELIELVNESANAGRVGVAGLWDEDHVLLQVASSLVMLAVGNLP